MPINHRTPAAFFSILVVLLVPTVYCYAQESSENVEIATFTLDADEIVTGKFLDLGSVLWLFREGDDAAWAAPDLDERSWELRDPGLFEDSTHSDVWKGIGWFRLHLEVDSALFGKTLAIHPYQMGASEIYLNGTFVDGFGTIGEQEESFSAKGLITHMQLGSRQNQVLAVRYSNRAVSDRALDWLRESVLTPAGFTLVVGDPTVTARSFLFDTTGIYGDAVIMGFLIAILLLHLFLFISYRQDRSNLLYVLAMMFLIVMHFTGHANGYRFALIDGSWNALTLDIPGTLSLYIFLFFFLSTLYASFFPEKLRSFFRWGSAVLLVLTASLFVLELVFDTRPYPVFMLSLFLGLAEGLRVLIQAVRHNRPGARILVISLIVTIIPVVIRLSQSGSMSRTDFITQVVERPELFTANGIGLVFFFLPIPVGMSAVLALQFSTRSRRLENELKRVEALSAKTIRQEQEKQELISKQNELLEAEVADRTSALKQSLEDLKRTQQQLIHAEKMSSLGLLTAGIAHEIQNPLNFINNFADLSVEMTEELAHAFDSDPESTLKDQAETITDLQRNSELIRQHGKRADGIVKSMMQHANVGSGTKIATDLNRLVSEHIELVYHSQLAQNPAMEVTVTQDFDPTVGKVNVVPQEIGRVLINIVGNAMQAVMQREKMADLTYRPTVSVSTARHDQSVQIIIKDNGTGIPEDIQSKIFEPFFTTKPSGSGTGLGLSISYDIVTKGHGGRIEVESEEGIGATFFISLPAGIVDRNST